MKVASIIPGFWICLALSGCALLDLDSRSDEDEMYEGDPVAQAALPYRNRGPASLSLTSTERSSVSQETPSNSGNSQLMVGMTMPRVRSLWGFPQDVQTAGESNSLNQKWVYSNGLNQRWGTSTYRVVYFEQGRVVGWESGR